MDVHAKPWISIDIHTFPCETRRWLEDPVDALLPEDEWPSEPEKAKVYCDESEWPRVVHLAFKRGVLDAFGHHEQEEVFAPKGKPCTVGCFGVIRPKDPITPNGAWAPHDH